MPRKSANAVSLEEMQDETTSTTEVETTEEVVETPTETEAPQLAEEPVEETEEVIETKNGFSLFRQGDKYTVKQGNINIAPFMGKDEAEQLFRGMTRKF